MTPLGQGELLEVTPTRRLIVPMGHGHWWGVDPGTQRVALAALEPRMVQTVSFAHLSGGERLRAIYHGVRELAYDVALAWPPGLVWVEQPSGKQQNPSLSYAVGVTLAALFDGVQLRTGSRVKVSTVVSTSWKRIACGAGNIYKPKPTDDREYGVLTWARSAGYEGASWDAADAWGIAEAARRTVALEER